MMSHSILRAVTRTCFPIGGIGHSGGTLGHNTIPRTLEECGIFPNRAKYFSTPPGASSSKIDEEYQEAVRVLNTLLPINEEERKKKLIATTGQSQWRPPEDLSYILKSLARSGLALEELEKQSFIHVAGTKGKGTTVALTETILRTHGAKTGLYTSPHLISLTERIRINGEPIAKEKFTCAFWKVFELLEDDLRRDDTIGAYYQLMTVLCFHIFLEEKTDVNILEVGIGGELDCTNIIRNTQTVGITSLGLEHTLVLGSTLEEIAWQKAGIIKPGSNVYTYAKQPECLEVIRQRAEEKKATAVYEVPEFSEYFQDPKFRDALSKISNVSVKINFSLAIQLAYDWLRIHKSDIYRNYAPNTTQLTDKVVEGVTNTFWPGRCQLVKFLNYNVHLDGAHTVESMRISVQWFCESTQNSENPKVLFYHATKGHDFRPMISILRKNINFDMVYFVPNIYTGDKNTIRYDFLPGIGEEHQLSRIHIHKKEWKKLNEELGEADNSHAFRSFLEGFNHMQNCFGDYQQLDVLVTGSLYLVGVAIATLNDFKKKLEGSESFLNNFKFLRE